MRFSSPRENLENQKGADLVYLNKKKENSESTEEIYLQYMKT